MDPNTSPNVEKDTTQDPNPTFFSGWRPAIGWISVIGFSLNFAVFPILEAVGVWIKHPVTLPRVDQSGLMTMTTTFLGTGVMRTVEKIFKVHGDH